MRKKVKLTLLVIIIAIVFITVIIHSLSIGPKGEQIPMYALIFRGYEVDGKLAVYAPWESYDWQFYEPSGYNEKYSREYKERIYIASFYYEEKQKANQAFGKYKTLLTSKGFNGSYFAVKVNDTEKFKLVDSFALESNDFIYSELIETKGAYLPGYYIITIKSNISEKEFIKTIVK